MKKLLIYGSSDFARLLYRSLADYGFEFAGFIDDQNSGEKILGSYSQLKDKIQTDKLPVILGIGYKDLQARFKVLQRLLNDGIELPNLIHPQASVLKSAKLGRANIIMAQSHLDYGVEVGDGCVFWNQSNISHDVRIGSNCFFSPSSVVCGYTTMGDSIFVGAQATIVEKLNVASDRFIKAASLICK